MKGETIGTILGILLFVVVIAVALLIRLAIAGGDWGCVFSQDPAICIAVKNT